MYETLNTTARKQPRFQLSGWILLYVFSRPAHTCCVVCAQQLSKTPLTFWPRTAHATSRHVLCLLLKHQQQKPLLKAFGTYFVFSTDFYWAFKVYKTESIQDASQYLAIKLQNDNEKVKCGKEKQTNEKHLVDFSCKQVIFIFSVPQTLVCILQI